MHDVATESFVLQSSSYYPNCGVRRTTKWVFKFQYNYSINATKVAYTAQSCWGM